MTPADEIFALFESRGSDAYFGERVTVTDHCRQTAWCAQQQGAPASLVVAALLHDIGHLLEAVPEDLADWVQDARHEELGEAWLARRFGPEVFAPVRLHVPAKRYLCATEPSYLAGLSPASVHTLGLQGGVMSAAEVAAFEREPWFPQAVQVRRWDDRGKIDGARIPELREFRTLIDSVAGARAAGP